MKPPHWNHYPPDRDLLGRVLWVALILSIIALAYLFTR